MNSLSDDYQRFIQPIEGQLLWSIARILKNPDDADEALQAALETIWKKFAIVRAHPNPPALMMRMAMNAAYDLLRIISRRRKREPADLHEGIVDIQLSAFDRLSSSEWQQEIYRAIRRLSRKQAQAILMRFIQEMDFPEIASALGCCETTARTHVKRGCARLRFLLGQSTLMESREIRS